MRHLALAASALLLSLGACSPAAPAPDASGAEAGTTDAASDRAAPPSEAGSGADASADAAPLVFTMTPYLTTMPVRTFASAPAMMLGAGKDYRAEIVTDVGTITLDLFEDQTPITVNSFVFLALNHYFDGVAFHRVVEGFVAQGGDPLSVDETMRARWGTGGPGYRFGLEIVDSLNFDTRGMVGMARTMDPNSNGSQFFIMLAPAPSLDTQYTVFARLVDGDPVLDRLARGMPPATPSRMSTVRILERMR